jgi:hypothetical protein
LRTEKETALPWRTDWRSPEIFVTRRTLNANFDSSMGELKLKGSWTTIASAPRWTEYANSTGR